MSSISRSVSGFPLLLPVVSNALETRFFLTAPSHSTSDCVCDNILGTRLVSSVDVTGALIKGVINTV